MDLVEVEKMDLVDKRKMDLAMTGVRRRMAEREMILLLLTGTILLMSQLLGVVRVIVHGI